MARKASSPTSPFLQQEMTDPGHLGDTFVGRRGAFFFFFFRSGGCGSNLGTPKNHEFPNETTRWIYIYRDNDNS